MTENVQPMLGLPTLFQGGLKFMDEIGSRFGAARFGVVGADRSGGTNELIDNRSRDAGLFERGGQVQRRCADAAHARLDVKVDGCHNY